LPGLNGGGAVYINFMQNSTTFSLIYLRGIHNQQTFQKKYKMTLKYQYIIKIAWHNNHYNSTTWYDRRV